VSLIRFGSLVESQLGSLEFLRYLTFTTVTTGGCSFLFAVISFMITGAEELVFQAISGMSCILISTLMSVKLFFPESPLLPFDRRFTQGDLPLVVLIVLGINALLPLGGSNMGFVCSLFSFIFSWVYLRFLRINPQTGLTGDDSEDFSFVGLFPTTIQPIIRFCASLVSMLFRICGIIKKSKKVQNTTRTQQVEDGDAVSLRRKALALQVINEKLSEKYGEGQKDDKV
jgi:hypothetical protein